MNVYAENILFYCTAMIAFFRTNIKYVSGKEKLRMGVLPCLAETFYWTSKIRIRARTAMLFGVLP